MKRLFLCVFLAVVTVMAGSSRLSAQASKFQTNPSKTITSSKLESVVSTFESTESIRLDNVGHEMLVTPIIASVKVIARKNSDGSYTRATFKGSARTDIPKGLKGNEYLASKVFDGKTLTGITIDLIKAQATYDFCAETGADLIVLPQFNIHHKMQTVKALDENGNEIEIDEPIEINGKYVMVVDVVGYPAIYTNFRDGTVEDRWIKQMYREGQITNDGQVIVTEEVSSNTRLK